MHELTCRDKYMMLVGTMILVDNNNDLLHYFQNIDDLTTIIKKNSKKYSSPCLENMTTVLKKSRPSVQHGWPRVCED